MGNICYAERIVNSNINIMLLFCSSFRRLCLTQATLRPRHGRDPPAGVWPTDRSTTSPTPIMDSIHGQDFAKTVTSPPESRLGRTFTWFALILLYDQSFVLILSYDQCVINLPWRTWVFDLITWFAWCWRWLFFLMMKVWIAPLAEDAEDSFMFSKSFAFAFASSWFASYLHDHNY